MIHNSTLIKVSAFVIFLCTSTILLFFVLNIYSSPAEVSVIFFLCDFIIYKHIFDIIKSLRNLDGINE